MSDDEDYCHWKDDDDYSDVSTVAYDGYNRYNGLRTSEYHPANREEKGSKSETPAPVPKPQPQPVAPVCAPPLVAPPRYQPPQFQPSQYQPPQYLPPQQIYYMMGGGGGCYPMPYAGYPAQIQTPYPAAAYYPYPYGTPANGWPATTAAATVGTTAAEPAEEKKSKKKSRKPATTEWQGRTRAEVERDNMIIAKREGVCDPRKVEPKGLSEDQMVWCVELDGSHTLRTYATIKDFNGEWKADPRFENSWYFLRMKEDKK